MKSLQSHNFISINPIDRSGDPVLEWLDDYSHSVIPVSCHSHNDYLRPYPLLSALAAGCMSVEADVWLSQDGEDILVGHNALALSEKKTLQTLYLDPLAQILNQLNNRISVLSSGQTLSRHGVFRTRPDHTLLLFIDVKDNATATWPVVMQQLGKLRENGYLTQVKLDTKTSQYTQAKGPITIIGTGNIVTSHSILGTGCASLTAFNDTFLDAPLDELANDKNFEYLVDCHTYSFLRLPVAKYYAASTSFATSIGSVRTGFNANQLNKLRRSLQAARSRNLTSRYWGTPDWPISLRDYVWQVLVNEGADLLNADDVESAARLEWNKGYKAEIVCLVLSCTCVFLVSIFITRRWK